MFLLAPKMSCQARVLNEQKELPVSHEVYYTTKECGQEASHVELIDDGDSEMKLCTCCTSRYKANDSWYGFFDCGFPPMARIFGSSWYYERMRLEDIESDVEEEEVEEEEVEEEEVPVLELPQTLASEEEAPAPEVEEITEMMKVSSIIDKKEEISQKIKTLKTQLKKPGLDIKTMQAYNKEIIELRTTLRKMK
jgi:hypothetical protein